MKYWSKILHDCWLERSLERVCKISPYPREMQTSVEIVAIGREGYAVAGVCKRATCLTFAIPFHECGHELERWKRGRGTAERDVSKFPDAHSHRFLSSVSRRGGGEQMLSITFPRNLHAHSQTDFYRRVGQHSILITIDGWIEEDGCGFPSPSPYRGRKKKSGNNDGVSRHESCVRKSVVNSLGFH